MPLAVTMSTTKTDGNGNICAQVVVNRAWRANLRQFSLFFISIKSRFPLDPSLFLLLEHRARSFLVNIIGRISQKVLILDC